MELCYVVSEDVLEYLRFSKHTHRPTICSKLLFTLAFALYLLLQK